MVIQAKVVRTSSPAQYFTFNLYNGFMNVEEQTPEPGQVGKERLMYSGTAKTLYEMCGVEEGTHVADSRKTDFQGRSLDQVLGQNQGTLKTQGLSHSIHLNEINDGDLADLIQASYLDIDPPVPLFVGNVEQASQLMRSYIEKATQTAERNLGSNPSAELRVGIVQFQENDPRAVVTLACFDSIKDILYLNRNMLEKMSLAAARGENVSIVTNSDDIVNYHKLPEERHGLQARINFLKEKIVHTDDDENKARMGETLQSLVNLLQDVDS